MLVGTGVLDGPFHKPTNFRRGDSRIARDRNNESISAFSFGARGAKEKAWQKETRRFRGAPRSTPRKRGFLKKAPFETEKH